jgi:D-threo-aldose 1-dehydrogenase
MVPALRGVVSKKAQKLSQKSVFTPDAARKSLDDSLTALKTDHVDLFLLHEPAYADAASEELQQFLDDEVRRGRIRAYGCGGDFDVIQSVATAKLATAGWLQFEDNALRRRVGGIQASGARCITYGSLKGALGALTDWLKSVPGRSAEWELQLGVDCRSESGLAALLQADSHARNPDGIVLFSTHRADRIAGAVETASGNRFSPEQLLKFGELVKDVPISL